jgi:hypothetical protein
MRQSEVRMGKRQWLSTGFITLALATAPMMALAASSEFSKLKGFWECQEENGGYSTLEFLSPSSLSYNGEPSVYHIEGKLFRVQDEYGTTDYHYEFQEGSLVILSEEGSVTLCHKGKKPLQEKPAKHSAQQAPASGQHGAQGWPPAYTKPSGTVTWQSSDPQALLYKFAGRWDHVTRNTLTNLFLKPDGRYEEAYEAGYSGSFHDQGGNQTGNWGTAGTQQAGGTWYAEGTLEQGRLILTDRQGRRTVYNYRVHTERGEYYGGEYYFNGKLYSVNYIYR